MSLFIGGSVPLSRTPVPKTYDYKVIVPAATTPISLDELKTQLRIPLSYTDEDTYLTLIILSVTSFFEKYTNRILINTTFRTYRDCFPDSSCYGGSCFQLRRSSVVPISVEIEYKKGNAFVVFPSTDYYTLDSIDYANIYLVTGKSWPSDANKVLQAVKIEFVAGFGSDATYIPSDIKMALLQHATAMYVNRGDCDESSCTSFLPCGSRNIYDKYKVIVISQFPNCRCVC